MLCVTCKSEVSAAFKHAIAKNECPACGGAIFDEEMLALIDDIKGTIVGEAVLRDDTVQRLAMAMVARYDMSVRSGARAVSVAALAPAQQPMVAHAAPHAAQQPVQQVAPQRRPPEARPQERIQVEEEDVGGVKIAPPSAFQQIASSTSNPNVIGVADLERQAMISNEERIQIMEDAVKNRYNLVDNVPAVESQLTPEDMAMFGGAGPGVAIPPGIIDSGINPILEQERLARLQRQRASLGGANIGNPNAFRRSG